MVMKTSKLDNINNINLGLLIIITGPSGVGKKTAWAPIIKNKKIPINFSVSATTRKKRENEINGVDYFFLTKKEFKSLIHKKKLLEYAKYAGEYYGTPIDYVNKIRSKGENVLLEIECKGALKVMKLLKKNNDKNLLTIFIAPPSIAELKKRLINRSTESVWDIYKRIKLAKKELKKSKFYEHVIVNQNNKEKDTTKKIFEIIKDKINATITKK